MTEAATRRIRPFVDGSPEARQEFFRMLMADHGWTLEQVRRMAATGGCPLSEEEIQALGGAA